MPAEIPMSAFDLLSAKNKKFEKGFEEEIERLSSHELNIAQKIKNEIIDLRTESYSEVLFMILFGLFFISCFIFMKIVPIGLTLFGAIVVYIFASSFLRKKLVKRTLSSLAEDETIIARQIFPKDLG